MAFEKKWKYPTSAGKGKYNPIYACWNHMIGRCNNPKDASYHHYGGRGVTVCDDWFSYDNFYEWAIISGREDGLTLDRIDVNGNYEPSNCRWVDMKTQNRNKRDNVIIDGKCLTDVASERGINRQTLRNRQLSGSVDLYFTPKNQPILCEGYTFTELAEMCGVKVSTIRSRWYKGHRTLEELTKPVRGAK